MYNECTLEEVLAYRELEGEVFDFGEGPMRIDGLLGSEDVYYKMFINNHMDDSDEIMYKVESDEKQKRRKSRLNKYKRNKIDKRKIEKLRKEGAFYTVSHYRPYLRLYRGKRSRYLKKESNKIVRRYYKSISNGGSYRKTYPFWHNLF